ncbi:YbgC/FadM family acyl-CoA thioesterase [Erythrobacter sp. THAF29]|uniref:YbgC/FadM family acyl-CoA thioesterase n=1 Tax=Erythrobacter sp. THAF29 TaxID=2587851 RepID=UPI0012688449|nr:YbgC/FadM family acyl-CoA thioesterase [Erythrobacter sp. THAF29]QFT78762.1 Acyl-CoA thioester hydrolase YbgC [Erythrobacter sp. THAF29]
MVEPIPPGGVLDGPRHLYAVRVYYEDTDLSGITYHANYLRWFERARSDLLRMLGIDQRAAIEAGANGDGGAYAVSEINLRYLRPAKLDDDVVIETNCTDLGAASCRMHQIARRGDEELCEATLRVGFISLEGRPKRQPAEWRAAFQSLMDQEAR